SDVCSSDLSPYVSAAPAGLLQLQVSVNRAAGGAAVVGWGTIHTWRAQGPHERLFGIPGIVAMTCAKAVVKARLVTTSGLVFEGENTVTRPQAQCPRAEGEGYDKCTSVCGQLGHAEAMAILAARDAGVA